MDNSESNPNPEVRNHGQIAEMTLPTGWVEGPPYTSSGGVGTRSFRELHPADAPKSTLCFYYRGLLASPEAGTIFHEILEKPPHLLSSNELHALSEVLRDKAHPKDFNTTFARTEDLNGKRVLVVEGCYVGIEEEAVEVFVDASGDGRAVQEIYYQAPKELYSKHAKAARAAMKSIKWK